MGKLKKILIVIISIFIISPVYASENIIYVNEKGDNLYYKSENDYFIDHQNMLPGETYVDSMILENRAKNDYTFYLKTVLKNDDTSLLESINMIIKVDGKIVYEGTALGKEYLENQVNDNNLLKLGDIKSKGSKKIEINTTLGVMPDNYQDEKEGLIDFKIYASPVLSPSKNEEIREVIKTPITSKNQYMILAIVLIITGAFILLIITKKK